MSFRGFDEDDDEAFDELNFPVQETSLTQVSDRSSSQVPVFSLFRILNHVFK